MKRLVDTFSGLQEDNVWVLFSFYGALQCLLVASWSFSDFCATRFTSNYRCDIAETFLQRFYNYPYYFFQTQMGGALTAKISDAFTFMPALIFDILHNFCFFAIVSLLAAILLFVVHPFFSIAMIFWLTIFVVSTFRYIRKTKDLTQQYAQEKSIIMGVVSDFLTNILSVKTFAAKNYEQRRFNEAKRSFIEVGKKQHAQLTMFYLSRGILTSIYAMGLIAFLIHGHRHGFISPGDVAFVIMTNFNIISLAFTLTRVLREFVISWGAVDEAAKLLESAPVQEDPEGHTPICMTKGTITFESVKFQYPGISPLFQNKSVTIDGGTKVGLVGYSGGGKSTFVNLILGLHDVAEGRILIDEQDISRVTKDSLRKSMAFIPQDPTLFHRSLMDNIRYGSEYASDADVIAAAQKAHAHDFIMQLPYVMNHW